MKKAIIPTLAASLLIIAMLQGCHKEACPGGDPLPEEPVLWGVATSDCHTYTDKLAAKEMNTDSVVVTFSNEGSVASVTHYNMMLDCGTGNRIVTTIEHVGDTVTVTENVGEQGLANCVCLYDHSFEIHYLWTRPFTLVIKRVADYFGNIGETVVYQQTFE